MLQAILRLRLLCNNGPHQPLDAISDAKFGNTGAITIENGKTACAFCSCEILISDAPDKMSPGASYGDSSALVCPACLSPNEIRRCQNRGRLDIPKMPSIQCSQSTSLDEGLGPQYIVQHTEDIAPPDSRRSLLGNPTKLAALISNIEKTAPGNKR